MSKLPQPFNNPSTYPNHSGVDYGKPGNTPIYASGKGVVVFSGYRNDRAGYAVIVKYDVGCEVLYAHQPKNAARPSKGTTVLIGSYLGLVGTTGYSTGNHLHMEILVGKGASTYEGIWNYFDKNNWVGNGSNAGGSTDKSIMKADEAMLILVAISNSNDGLVREGWTLADSLTGPLTLITQAETDALNYWAEKGIPYRRAEWHGNDIRSLIDVRGIHPIVSDSGRSDYTQTSY